MNKHNYNSLIRRRAKVSRPGLFGAEPAGFLAWNNIEQEVALLLDLFLPIIRKPNKVVP